MDPRWKRREESPDAAGRQHSGDSEGSLRTRTASVAAQHEKHREANPADSDRGNAGYSIVFSPSWVSITTPIGEGAFSRVYEGVYTNPETQESSVVAVKVLKKNTLKRRSDCLRFIKEAKTMTKIQHPNIAACYGIGKYDEDDRMNPGAMFIVQELIKGGNLLHQVYKQMLNLGRRIYSAQAALNWMVNVAEGMQYLHSVTDNKPMIIHRDLKLENIMLSRTENESVAKLVDFGLHKVIDDRIKRIVKRVASEAVLSGAHSLLNQTSTTLPQPGMEEDQEEDELEVALREQRAAQQQSVTAARDSNSGPESPSRHCVGTLSGGNAGGRSGTRRLPQQRASRLSLVANATCNMEVMPEESEEHANAAPGQGDTEVKPVSCEESTSIGKNGIMLAPSQRERNLRADNGAVSRMNGLCDRAATAQRTAPKKQHSVQKLISKMRDIGFRVANKLVDTVDDEHRANAGGPATAMSIEASGKSSDAMSTKSASSPTSSAQPGETLAIPAASIDPERHARNEALLNRILAQQNAAMANVTAGAQHFTSGFDEGAGNKYDASGLLDPGAACKRVRAPPRRVVTWVNEIRYNLTVAVGSWAYMAPEVVLGHPYNEKVKIGSLCELLLCVKTASLGGNCRLESLNRNKVDQAGRWNHGDRHKGRGK